MAAPRRTTPPALRVLNWGMGKHSTTLALLAHHGEIPRFDAILCADTQSEPGEVYETVEWVMGVIDMPVYRVTAGNLGQDTLDVVARHGAGEQMTAGHAGQPPFWVKNDPNKDYATADSGGQLWRKCTHDYKIVPIRRKIRELLGLKPTGGVPKGLWVEQAIGFPRNEHWRTFCSDVFYITNTFPLIMLGMRDEDCDRWLTQHGYPIPPKSACIFCPYHTNVYWRRMRDTRPEDWHQAVDFETKLHAGKLPGVRGIPYLHRSMVPLPLAPIDEPETGQLDLFCYACNT